MEIYQIKALDCKKKKNRKKLAKEVSTLLGRDSALSKEQIKKAATSISKKYGMYIQLIKNSEIRENAIIVSVNTGHGYSTYHANTLYEVYAKFILMVHEYYKLSKMEPK